jgi:hypothetical protein
VVGLGVGVDVFLQELAREADGGEESDAGDAAKEARAEGDGGGWGIAIASAICFSSFLF